MTRPALLFLALLALALGGGCAQLPTAKDPVTALVTGEPFAGGAVVFAWEGGLLVGSPEAVATVDPDTGSLRRVRLPDGGWTPIASAREGVEVAREGERALWNPKTGALVRRWRLPPGVLVRRVTARGTTVELRGEQEKSLTVRVRAKDGAEWPIEPAGLKSVFVASMALSGERLFLWGQDFSIDREVNGLWVYDLTSRPPRRIAWADGRFDHLVEGTDGEVYALIPRPETGMDARYIYDVARLRADPERHRIAREYVTRLGGTGRDFAVLPGGRLAILSDPGFRRRVELHIAKPNEKARRVIVREVGRKG